MKGRQCDNRVSRTGVGCIIKAVRGSKLPLQLPIICHMVVRRGESTGSRESVHKMFSDNCENQTKYKRTKDGIGEGQACDTRKGKC